MAVCEVFQVDAHDPIERHIQIRKVRNSPLTFVERDDSVVAQVQLLESGVLDLADTPNSVVVQLQSHQLWEGAGVDFEVLYSVVLQV